MQANQSEVVGQVAVAGAAIWPDGEDRHPGVSEANNGRAPRKPRGGSASGDDAQADMNMRGAELIVTACVVCVFGVSQQELAGRSRGLAHVALARQVAMYLHHVVLRQTLTAVANRFARDRTTVAHACRVVEDRRDDPAFEELLNAIERAVEGALGPLSRSRRGRG
ncbi:helix-turn-helix domain-containing protein [Stappia stellulata]|uniref:helix-turn-helix domain-containing protein n=1 Tax=Stappia stellulata TaxID=71235 RepID=UPI0003FB5290|nr:helix-turn-helix domain-containing protein [Stappia stellulata]